MLIKVIIAVILIGSKSYATNTPDFNSCRSLSPSERDNCLLNLSHSMGDIKPKIYKLKSSVAFREGMSTDSDDFSDVGQEFILSFTPRVEFEIKDGTRYFLEIPMVSRVDTSINSVPTKTVGRPQIGALFPVGDGWKLGGAIRLPLYSSSEPFAERLRIFGGSFNVIYSQKIWSNFNFNASTEIHFDANYNMAVHYDGDLSVYGYFYQKPITSKTIFGVSTDGPSSWSLNFIANYGIDGKIVRTDRPKGSDTEAIPGIQMTALEIGWKRRWTEDFDSKIKIQKSLKNEARFYAGEYANPDDPSFSSNIAIEASLSKDF